MKRIYNVIVVDESGSMYCVKRQTITGLNETIQSARNAQEKHPEQQHFITLITFHDHESRIILNAAPALQVLDVKPQQYEPSGSTPLYDAVGRAITLTSEQVQPQDSVLVTILTDGYENSSREYTQQSITALIDDKKKLDWVFTFIGANIDVEQTSASFHIDFCAEFDQSVQGTAHMFKRERAWRDRVYDEVSKKSNARLSDVAQKVGFIKSDKKRHH